MYRQLIIRHYEKPIYEASSPVALFGTLEGYVIDGHEPSHKTGFLHQDIPINNLV